MAPVTYALAPVIASGTLAAEGEQAGHRRGQRAAGPVGVPVVLPDGGEVLLSAGPAAQVVDRVPGRVPALDQHPRGPEGQQPFGQHLGRCLRIQTGQQGGLVEVRRDHGGLREEPLGQRAHRIDVDQPVPVLADAHRVDDQRHAGRLLGDQLGDAAPRYGRSRASPS